MSDEPKKAVTIRVVIEDGPETRIAGKSIAPADYVFNPPFELLGLSRGPAGLDEVIIKNNDYARRIYKVGVGFSVPGRDGLNEASRADNKKPPNDRLEPFVVAALLRLAESGKLKEKELDTFLDDAEKYLTGRLPANWPGQVIWRLLPEQITGTIGAAETFKLPSHSFMITLLAMFAGKPERIPRAIFTSDFAKLPRDDREKAEAQAQAIFNEILGEKRPVKMDDGREMEAQYYIVSDNPTVRAEARLDENLLGELPQERERSLALYIKKAFGPEGLRHFLALIIGLDENYNNGVFTWSLNEHLERLKYKKENRSYSPELKEMARQIVTVFLSFYITTNKKRGKKLDIDDHLLFVQEGRGQTIDLENKEILDSRVVIRATDFWYKNAFIPKDDKTAPKYTRLLKKIVTESHANHRITIYLAPLLAIKWRMRLTQAVRVKNLMEWCDLDTTSPRRTDDLRLFEGELNYMKDRGYLGGWNNSGENPKPSDCADPFNCVLTLTPPADLEGVIKQIKEKRDAFLLAPADPSPEILTLEELKRLMAKAKLKQNQISGHAGVSKQQISMILAGKRNITKDVSDNLKANLAEYFPL